MKAGHLGKTFVFDYGALAVEVRYLTETRLSWEQIRGPEVGQKAVESYGSVAVRPGVLFFWWQEKDTSVVTQVVDFEKGRVFTAWTSPEKKLGQFEGKVRPWNARP